MKLTYAIWNTLAGGTDAGSDARLRRQMALLASFSPTVVGLQECKYRDWDYFRTFHLAEELLGMRGFLAPECAPRLPPGDLHPRERRPAGNRTAP